MIRTRTAVALLVLAGLVGCTSTDSEPPGAGDPTGAASPSRSTSSTPVGARDDIEKLLRQRARALMDRDRAAFSDGLVAGASAKRQLRDFTSIGRFPVGKVVYRLGMHDPSVGGERYRADVEMLVQLDGFDPAPVPTEHRFEFRRTPGGWRVASDRADRSQVGFAPWLLRDADVYVSDTLVAVFDSGSASQGDRFARLAEDALRRVQADVAVPFDGKAVVLAPSRTDALRYEGFNPVEIGKLGGVAYPVRGPDQQVDDLRVVIAPVMLTAEDAALETVLRHEFAHTALVQPGDSEIPTWVSEGVAEYTAHLGDDRYFIDRAAVDAAEEGITQMPPDGLFHSADWGPSYGIAWFSMLALAQREGADEPYALLAAIRKRAPSDFREVSALLEKRYGLSTDELAAQAGDLIAATFG